MVMKKGKCKYWRKIGECWMNEEQAKTCGALQPNGWCLSYIVDDEIPIEPELYYHP